MPRSDDADAGLRFAADGPLATVTLSAPERRNPQTPATWRALAAFGRSLPDAVRVVLLRADGPSFSAGLDRALVSPASTDPESLPALAATSGEAFDAAVASYQEAFSWWRRSPAVSVAAVGGHAVGAGFQLALAADLRVVADDVRFVVREPALGLVPDLGGTARLVELVGPSRALEICATGREIGASEAVSIGLATVAVPRGELDEVARELAEALLATPAVALRETAQLVRPAASRSYDDQLAAERAAQRRCLRALAGADPRGDGQWTSR